MAESSRIQRFFERLLDSEWHRFPAAGPVSAPPEQGVYVIRDVRGRVLHVGRTVRCARGLEKRLTGHIRGQSSFVRNYLAGEQAALRSASYQYIVVENDRTRALLEAYACGVLCPAHVGTGRRGDRE